MSKKKSKILKLWAVPHSDYPSEIFTCFTSKKEAKSYAKHYEQKIVGPLFMASSYSK